jgi:hypothetical protein
MCSAAMMYLSVCVFCHCIGRRIRRCLHFGYVRRRIRQFGEFLVHQVSKSLFVSVVRASGVELVFVLHLWCIRRLIRNLCSVGVPPQGSAVII